MVRFLTDLKFDYRYLDTSLNSVYLTHLRQYLDMLHVCKEELFLVQKCC